jgi:methyl-accepting chemotaxis protein
VDKKTHKSYQRKHFLINKPFQIRFMIYILAILLIVMGASLASMYYGIWGSVLKELSDEGMRNKLIVANRIYQYEKAREIDSGIEASDASLNFIRETELLSQREREIFKEILHRTNQRLFIYLLPLLIFIGWGTIFLSHKIAGPLYRFDRCFKDIRGGNLTTRAHLRKYDEALWLSESFNEMAESLDNQIATIKKSAEEILPSLPSSNSAKDVLEDTLLGFKTSK